MNLSEKLRLELLIESFNVFNMVNLGNPIKTFTAGTDGRKTNPNFGRITSSLEARRLQFGARLTF